ncbi:MAG: DUF1801 domain-containing protein [Pseudomonadota bacterium]
MAQMSMSNAKVAAVFAQFSQAVRPGLLRLRDLIFDTAATTPGVGALEETLKWGQPAYLTPQTKSGTTIRLGVPKTGGFALYVHCQTSIIAEARALFSDTLRYEGNRAIHFDTRSALPTDVLRLVIARALTYHLQNDAMALSPAR